MAKKNAVMRRSMMNALPANMFSQDFLLTQTNGLLDSMLDYKELMLYYSCAIRIIKAKLEVLDSEFALKYKRNPISSISSRLKSQMSIMQKMSRKGLPMSRESVEENLNDIAGVRVICPYIDDIYLIADALTAQDDIELLRVKDYIKEPKENGYRSLHLIVSVPVYFAESVKHVKAEIQIRTIAMDFWASLEHQIKYKKNADNAEEVIAELKTCADTIAATDERMQAIRIDMEALRGEPTAQEELLEKIKKFES